MSISNNYIRGTLLQSDNFVMVGRYTTTAGNTGYGMMTTSDPTTLPPNSAMYGGLYDFEKTLPTTAPDLVANLYSFTKGTGDVYSLRLTGSTTSFDTAPIETPANGLVLAQAGNPPVAILKNGAVSDTASLIVLKPHIPVDTEEIYTGVWYDIADLHNNLVHWPWWRTKTPAYPLDSDVVGVTAPDYLITQITFVPFGQINMYTILSGVAAAGSMSVGIKTFTSWVEGDTNANQVNCDGDLTKKKTNNCIFTKNAIRGQITGTYLTHGYNYCPLGDTCGKCLGICKSATVSSLSTTELCYLQVGRSDFVCATSPPTGSNKKHNHNIAVYVGILLGVLLILLVFSHLALGKIVWKK